MTTMQSPGSVVPTRFRWWSATASACGKVASIGIPIGAGAYLFTKHWGRADPEYLFTTSFSRNPQFLREGIPPFLMKALSEALDFDQWVILGYFLMLITCALVFTALAFSKSGKKLSHYILATAIVAAFAHLLEDALIFCVLRARRRHRKGWWLRGSGYGKRYLGRGRGQAELILRRMKVPLRQKNLPMALLLRPCASGATRGAIISRSAHSSLVTGTHTAPALGYLCLVEGTAEECWPGRRKGFLGTCSSSKTRATG